MNIRRLGGPLGTLAAVAGGGTVGSMVPLVGIIGTLAGIAAGAALVGAVAGGRRYVGVGLAGAVTMVALVGLSTLTSLLAPSRSASSPRWAPPSAWARASPGRSRGSWATTSAATCGRGCCGRCDHASVQPSGVRRMMPASASSATAAAAVASATRSSIATVAMG
jgi:hypothetical protein